MTSHDRLFAVCLGGRAERCNTELHDVVFVVGPSVEAAYDQLIGKWFGLPEGLHIDSWVELDVVDGFEVSLAPRPSGEARRLWFVNLGAYRAGEFAEAHANLFVVAGSGGEAKARAKAALLKDGALQVHTDDLYEVDSCIEIGAVNGFHIALSPAANPRPLRVNNGYHVIPAPVIAAYLARRPQRGPEPYRRPYV
jgi:hypothetical protein